MTDVKYFLIETLFAFPLLLLFARIFFQLFRVPFSHPIYQWIAETMNPIIRPIERVIPRWRNLCLAALLLMWLTCVIKSWFYYEVPNLFSLFVIGAAELGLWISRAFMFLLFIYIVMSFVQPRGNALTELVIRMIEPLLMPIRRRLPLFGPLDLSPLVLVFAYVLLTALLFRPMIAMAMGAPASLAFL